MTGLSSSSSSSSLGWQQLFSQLQPFSSSSSSLPLSLSPLSLLLLLLLAVVLYYYYYYYYYRSSDGCCFSNTFMVPQKKKECPWPFVPGGYPIIGNVIPGGIENIVATLEEWAIKHGKEHGAYRFRPPSLFGGKNNIVHVLCRDDKILQVEKRRPYDVVRRKRVTEVLKSVTGTSCGGVFTAEGAEWRKDRKLFGPPLNRKNVKDYVSIAKLVSKRLVTKWENSTVIIDSSSKNTNHHNDHKCGEVTINDDLLSYTMDVISLVGFAHDMDSLRRKKKKKTTRNASENDNEEEDEKPFLGDDIKKTFRFAMKRIFSPIPYWNIPVMGRYLDGCQAVMDRTTRHIKTVIEDHERTIRRQEQEAAGSANAKETAENNERRVGAAGRGGGGSDSDDNDTASTKSSSSSSSFSSSSSSSGERTNRGNGNNERSTTTTTTTQNDDDDDDDDRRRAKSFLGKLLTEHKKESNRDRKKENDLSPSPSTPFLTEDRIAANLMTLFLAGSETTYSTLVVALHDLSNDETGLQSELHEEVTALFDGDDDNGKKNNENENNNNNNNDDDCADDTVAVAANHSEKKKMMIPGDDDNDDNDASIGYEELRDGLPKLRSFVYEILRMKGPSPVLGAETAKEIEIDGIRFPPGTPFILLARHASTLSEMEEEEEEERGGGGKKTIRGVPRGPRDSPPNKFCPRRWLVPSLSSSSSSTKKTEEKETEKTDRCWTVIQPTYKSGYRAFGSGARVCPGRDLAEMEILTLLSYLIRSFEMNLSESQEPIRFVTRLTQTPNVQIKLKLKKR